MLGKLVRICFALTAIAPLSLSLAYIYASRQHNYQYALIAILSCAMLGCLSIWIVEKAQDRLEPLAVEITKAKSTDKEVIGFFVAYVLPLVFRGQNPPDFGSWILVGVMLLFVLWSTHSLQVNPVLGMLGFHFYDVETSDGVTFLLITKRSISNVQSIGQVVQLSEYGILEARTTNKGAARK